MTDFLHNPVGDISFLSTSAAIGWFYDPTAGIITASSYTITKIVLFAIYTITENSYLRSAYAQKARQLSLSTRVIKKCYFAIRYLTKKNTQQTIVVKQLTHDCRKAQQSDAENLSLLCDLTGELCDKQRAVKELQRQIQAQEAQESTGLRAIITASISSRRGGERRSVDIRQIAALKRQKEELARRIALLEAKDGLCKQCSMPSLEKGAGGIESDSD